MPRSTASHRTPWTASSLRTLASLHRQKLPVAEIAKRLGRTPGAVYQRLSAEGLSTPRRKARAKRARRTG